MPTLFQGFGTAFVGKRDFWPDGSYVTTEWIVAFCVPLVPTKSLRVKRTRHDSHGGLPPLWFSNERGYVVQDETPTNGKQALCVYGFMVVYAGWVIAALQFLPGAWWHTIAILPVLALPFAVPLCLRARAKRWRPGFK